MVEQLEVAFFPVLEVKGVARAWNAKRAIFYPSMKYLFAVVVSLLVSALSVQGKENPGLSDAWHFMSGISAREAMKVLEQQPATPERQLAEATSMLGIYPQTPQNVERARVILFAMIAVEERSNFQAAALYLLGRISHIFEVNQESEAEYYYQQLRDKYPENQLADSAAVKLALIALGQMPRGIPNREERLVIEALPMPRNRYAQGDFHYVLADYYMERGDLSSALERLMSVRELNTLMGRNQAALLVQIGRVATVLKRTEIAIEAYQSFLRSFPNDDRKYMAGEELKTLLNGGSS